MHALSASPSRVDRRSALQLLRVSLLCWLKPFQERLQLQIRNAIIESGRTSQIAGFFDEIDRGRGLPDAYAAFLLLESGAVPDVLPYVKPPYDLVKDNIEKNTDLNVVSGSYYKTLSGLQPGERGEILYNVPPGTGSVIVRIKNIVMSGPQNPFFGGDGLFLYIHSAKTSVD